MTHDDARALMPLYVMGEADSAARAQLGAHLRDCEDCRAALQGEWLAADALGRSVPQVEPPSALRARVLSVAARPVEVSHYPGRNARAVVSGRWPWMLATAAALVAAIGAAVGFRGARADLTAAHAALAEARLTISASDVAATQARKAAFDQQAVTAVLTADDLVQVPLRGVAPAQSAQARVFMSTSRGMIFTAHGLPALPSHHVYQLWAIAAGAPISAGTFVLDEHGAGRVVGPMPPAAALPDAVAVTLEPEGGVHAPTGPKVLVSGPG